LAATGLISGIPTTAGTFFISVALTDSATGSVDQGGLSVVVNAFPIENPGALPDALIGLPYQVALTAPLCQNCSWSAFGVPAGLSLSSAGVLAGTPTAATDTTMTITATGSNGSARRTFALRVVPTTPRPLVISTSAVGPTVLGTSPLSRLLAQGGSPPYTWQVESGELPTGLELAAGEAVGTAPGATVAGRAVERGTFDFTLRVTDAEGATYSRDFSWTITEISPQYFSLPVNFTGTTAAPPNPLVYDQPYTQPLLVVGGTNEYTFSAVTALPPGLTLSADGVISGTPLNTGFSSTTIEVVDTAGNFNRFNLSFNVSGPTATTLSFSGGPNFGTRSRGFTHTFNVTPTGGTPPYSVTAVGALPAGFALMSGDAQLSNAAAVTVAGIPLALGLQTFTLRAEDSAGNVGVRTFTFYVTPVTPFTNANLHDASVGVAYAQDLIAFDSAGGVTWTIAFGSALPPGLNLSPAGVIGGTPTSAGNYSFTLVSTDALGGQLNTTFNLRISAMRISDDVVLPEVAILGEPFSHTFSGSAGVWSATSVPPGLSMSADGTLSGTPRATGMFTMTVSLTDGVLPLSRRVTVFIRQRNAGVLGIETSQLSDVTVGQSIGFTLTADGGIPPYEWRVVSGALPPGLQLIEVGANLPNFTPGATLLAGAPTTAGLYTFELEVRDTAGATTRHGLTLNVSPVHIPSGAPRAAVAGAAYAQVFTAVGGTPPYTYALRSLEPAQDALPPGFSLSASGVLSGNTHSTGNYTFELTATDSAGQKFARVLTLLVNNANGLRVTSDNPSDVWVGLGRSTVGLATNGTSTYAWSVVDGALPPGVGLVLDDGSTELAGAPSTAGTYTFTLRATDLANPANFADHAFTYRVAPMQLVNPPAALMTLLDLPSGQVGTPYSMTFELAGGARPFTFSDSPFDSLPPGLTLSADGVLAGIPTASGTFVLQPIITDADGATLNAPEMTLVIAAAGRVPPLIAAPAAGLPDGSVGVPYISDFLERPAFTRGGVPPFALAVSPGSELPPGLVVLAGANGISDRIGGVPTTAGDYEFALEISDSIGQSVRVTLTQSITPLAMTPGALRSARVGSPYAESLLVSGSVMPYTLLLDIVSDLPPGLSLNSAGLLSGLPAAPGNFRLRFEVSDATGESLTVSYNVTVDNAAGEAPAIELTPKPIQVLYQTGSPAPTAIPVNVTSSSGSLSFVAALSGIPGATISDDGGTTASVLNVSVPALAVGTYQGVLTVQSDDAVNSFDAVPVLVMSTAPPPCTVALDPPAASISVLGGAGTVNVVTPPGCTWSATLPPSGVIAVNGAKSGTGPGTLSYTVPKNTGTSARTFDIKVGAHVHSIMQFGPGCSFTTSQSKIFATAAGGEATLTITPSSMDPACTWSATSATLALTPNAGGPSDQTLVVTIPPNPNSGARTLTASIAGRSLTVNQAAAECTVSLSSYGATSPALGGSGAVQVTLPTGCSYDTTTTASWLKVTSGGSGSSSGALFFFVEPNSVAASRSASLNIGGQPFQVTQEALPCSVTLDTAGLAQPFAVNGGAGIISITTNGPGCAWSASSGVSWAVVSPSSGAGSGTVGVTLQSNAASTEERSGELSVGGQTIAISQAGTSCSYALQSVAGTVPAAGGSGTVGVIAPSACTWSSASDDPSWLTVTASGSGGSGEVRFNALPNDLPDPRTGSLTIAGVTYTVTQTGAPCSYLLPSGSVTIAAAGTNGSFAFSTASPSCTPAPISYTSWIDVTAVAFDGSSGDVQFSVEANPTTNARSGTIRIGEQNFTVVQTGGACGFSLNSTSEAFGAAGGDGMVLGSPSALGCTPDIGTDQPGFIDLGALSGPDNNIFRLNFALAPFSSLTPATRFGHVTFGGQIMTVKQKSY
jgi:hypothetical protein